jgi:diguanylate cyclase (GGDEF)-like protein
MEWKLRDCLDYSGFQELLDVVDEVLPVSVTVTDCDGVVMCAAGKQDLCTTYHRAHPRAAERCRESDRKLIRLHETCSVVCYRCPFDLVETTLPLAIDNRQCGEVRFGQFFLDPPDHDFFREQARLYGFAEDAYLDAVNRIPVLSQEQLDVKLSLFLRITRLLVERGLKQVQDMAAWQETKAGLLTQNEELKLLITTHAAGVERISRQIKKQTIEDPLTGLPNKERFEEILDREVRRARRAGHVTSLLICHIDNYKRYVDYYGSTVGDTCVRAVSSLLRRLFRRAADLAAHCREDEFAVIIPDTAAEHVVALAEKLRLALSELKIPQACPGGAACVTFSLGGVIATGRLDRHTAWFTAQADSALAQALSQGGNTVMLAQFLEEAPKV